MKNILLSTALLLLISMPATVAGLPIHAPAQTQHKALILSSLNGLVPMGMYATQTIYYLKQTGYDVTYLKDDAITLDFLLNHLNDYDLVIWRTNAFNWVHTVYWYIGEKTNDGAEQKYAADFAAGWINAQVGILGISSSFINHHLGPNTLTHVKLFLLIASDGNAVAPQLLRAGVSSVIFCNGVISLQFGLIDDLTTLLISYLSTGQNVLAAVYNTVSPFNNAQPKDPLDTNYAPPFWFVGDDTITII